MKKIIKKYGDTLIINFSAEDQKIYNIEEGDIADLADVIFIKKEAKKK